MKQLMSEAELGQAWGYQPNTLAKWRIRGCGPPYIKLPGGGVRYDPETSNEWLKARQVTSTSEAA